MVLKKIDITSKKNEELFKIDLSKICNTWDYYMAQYVNALNILIDIGVNKGVMLKQEFMPFLFIFRHMTIKAHMVNKGVCVNNRHNIMELSKLIGNDLPSNFLSDFKTLNLDGEGDCFRYIERNDGGKHYNSNMNIDILPTLCLYEKWSQEKGFVNVVPIKHVEIKRKDQKGNFLFHTQDCKYLGVMRTQYDFCVSTILQAVVEKTTSVDEIIMPLMFLLRHSIELGLKDNLKVAKLNNGREHKLRTLYNVLNKLYRKND